ncbi:hypothetical protein FPV67DRAFT_1578938, partial [Lyophyllum atratum]
MALPKDIPTLRARNSKNWTRPDNVWSSSNLSSHIMRCDTMPRHQGPCTDHVPIATIMDIPTKRTKEEPKRNFRDPDIPWSKFRADLTDRMAADDFPRPGPILTGEALCNHISKLTQAIQETIADRVPLTKPSPYMKRWWSKELEETRTRVMKLSADADRHRGLDDHESFAALDEAKKAY